MKTPVAKVVAKYARSAAASKPPGSGWEKAGEHGGMRKKKAGGGYTYWYPSTEHAEKAHAHHSEKADAASKAMFMNDGKTYSPDSAQHHRSMREHSEHAEHALEFAVKPRMKKLLQQDKFSADDLRGLKKHHLAQIVEKSAGSDGDYMGFPSKRALREHMNEWMTHKDLEDHLLSQ